MGRGGSSKKKFGKRIDYTDVIRRRTILREGGIWTVEILATIGVAFVIAYYLL